MCIKLRSDDLFQFRFRFRFRVHFRFRFRKFPLNPLALLKITGRLSQTTVTMKKRPPDIVSASLLMSGALSEVCEVTAAMRELDDRENDLVKDFVSQGCSYDFGHKKTPCSTLFQVEHYQSLRATFTEMSHDELGLFVMRQVKVHCYQSTTLQLHS